MSEIQKPLLYVSIFIPVYLIVLANEFDWLVLIAILVSTIAFVATLFGKSTGTFEIDSTMVNIGEKNLAFVLIYLLPLIPLTSFRFILFLMTFAIYNVNNLYYLNPLFALFGFKVYKTESNMIIITQMSIAELLSAKANGHTIFGKTLTPNIIIYSKIRKQ